jgi:hypothetical protein
MPMLAAPSALTAVVGILFTIVGLGTAKIAAEEWARVPAKLSAKQPEAPRQKRTLEPVSVEKAVRPAPAEAALVPTELQTARQGNHRKGNRQKRRRK